MTTEQILEQVRREPRTLIYFGDNIAQFREVAEAVYKYGDRLVAQIDEYQATQNCNWCFVLFAVSLTAGTS